MTGLGPGRGLVIRLGLAQLLAWASTFYLPAVLARPISADLHVSTTTVFAAFSVASVCSALSGPWAGHLIDRLGGRSVLMSTNVLFAFGLAALSQAQGVVSLFAAWAVLGVAMGAGLYEGAFAALVHLHGRHTRNAITGVTLIAGFASTVGWPLSAWLSSQMGWRDACLVWAALQLVIGLPLNAWLPRRTDLPERASSAMPLANDPTPPSDQPHRLRHALLLAWTFAATWFVGTSLGTHLPGLLERMGTSTTASLALAALLGPAQVAGRLLEFTALRRVHPLWSARWATIGQPLGAAALGLFGAPAAFVFVILHGAGHGAMTVAKGTLPLQLFGPQGYGRMQGWLILPSRFAQAAAPWLFGVVLDNSAAMALVLSSMIGLSACLSLWSIRLPKPEVVTATHTESVS